MQSPFDDKLAYSYPCKPTETCIDYDDYDPCESNEEITDRDLAILLKEEAAKLERQKKAETENEKQTSSNDAGDKDKQKQKSETEQEFIQEEEIVVKKKNCKFIKNPFFTDRLKLSTSHLPLPPPGPPPQNLPLAKDESETRICPRKTQKKCKKEDKYPQRSEDKYPQRSEDKLLLPVKYQESEREETEEKADECGEAEGMNEEIKGFHKKTKEKKKPCKKQINERPVCKKKESEVSVGFGPRNIPMQQKDPPKKSPKDIPEVERQILMACGKNEEEDCKKKCKKKDKVK